MVCVDKFEFYLEEIIAALAKFGRHARLVLFPNRSGEVRDGFGKVVLRFSSLRELYSKLYKGDY